MALLSASKTKLTQQQHLVWDSFEASKELEMLLAGHRLPQNVMLRTNAQVTLDLPPHRTAK
jgi:hypothetical protein